MARPQGDRERSNTTRYDTQQCVQEPKLLEVDKLLQVDQNGPPQLERRRAGCYKSTL